MMNDREIQNARELASKTIMAQLEIGDSEQWRDELYAAYLRRTGVAPEHAVLVVHTDPDTGDQSFSYRVVLGFEPDGGPVVAQLYPLPLAAWEYGRRVVERYPWLRPLGAAGVPVVAALLAWRLGKRGGGRS